MLLVGVPCVGSLRGEKMIGDSCALKHKTASNVFFDITLLDAVTPS